MRERGKQAVGAREVKAGRKEPILEDAPSSKLSAPKPRTRARLSRQQAERKAGVLLAGMEMHGGDRKSRLRGITLNDMGITKIQSSRWQREALVPDEELGTTLGKDAEATGEMPARPCPPHALPRPLGRV